MNFSFFDISIALLFLFNCISCKNSENAFVKFQLEDTTIELKGKHDTESDFYSCHWPNDFTKEKIASNKLENQNSFTGRITTFDNKDMFELIIDWPDEIIRISDADILSLKDDTIWSLSEEKGNWDSLNSKRTGKSMHYMLFKDNKEYLSFNEKAGFVHFTEIEALSDSTWLGKGSFEFGFHEGGGGFSTAKNGSFYLRFYRGL